MPTQFQLDELCGDVMKLNLDDKEGDVGSKGRGTSNGAAGSSIKQRSTLLT